MHVKVRQLHLSINVSKMVENYNTNGTP